MSVEAWRIVKTRHAAHAFDGGGARRFGGRWNSIGTPLVYCASSISRAALGILVHLEDPLALPGWSLCRVTFDESLVRPVEARSLPDGWASDRPPRALQELGDRWAREGSSAILAVPSVIVPEEANYLLNPGHTDFGRVLIDPPRPLTLDARLSRE